MHIELVQIGIVGSEHSMHIELVLIRIVGSEHSMRMIMKLQ